MRPSQRIVPFFAALLLAFSSAPATALIPYTRGLWDAVFPTAGDLDPFHILEHTPFPVSTYKAADETLNLARVDWKETPQAHILSLDVPGVKKEDMKMEVDENRVLRISGERKEEKEVESERWHRVERTAGKFWRQFRLPANADMENVKAQLADGVLRVTVPKLAAEKKRQARAVDIVEENKGGEEMKASAMKTEM
ncbi:17.6 kDa class I heat shock protein-like [Curcuma longa]|uniref:17.6 kDa class I heat shock protein-like n=1 Tax=Curcuma longa TaxID=136217 RepID=UPI003D9F3F07